jgi:hypothetical protein
MSWFAYLFWFAVFIFCGYLVIEINRSKTNRERVSELRGEMNRMEQIDVLNREIEMTEKRMIEDWNYYTDIFLRLPQIIETAVLRVVRYVVQIFMDVFAVRLYSVIG